MFWNILVAQLYHEFVITYVLKGSVQIFLSSELRNIPFRDKPNDLSTSVVYGDRDSFSVNLLTEKVHAMMQNGKLKLDMWFCHM